MTDADNKFSKSITQLDKSLGSASFKKIPGEESTLSRAAEVYNTKKAYTEYFTESEGSCTANIECPPDKPNTIYFGHN